MPYANDLSPEECLRLLKAGVFGRVALNTPAGPTIVPLNYSVVHGRIVVRTTPYSELGTHGPGARIAFEVDQVDYEFETGWSVLVRGHADLVTDSHELDEITATWSPRPWASGVRNAYFSLRWTDISGRRLGPSIDPRRDLPVDRMVGGG